MQTEAHKLSKGQFMSDIEPFKSKGLPTDSIIHKVVPGCGATTLELSFPRNSIIIEPNLPVIKGKCKKLNKGKRKNKEVQGVYEGIDVVDIEQYVRNRVGFKKILTTPEGFEKVTLALGESMYKEYFLLFDECEKAIQDVNFRPDIINPIDAFFKFKEKAFVSATPIMPSDPRFKKFTHVTVEPDYEFKQDITLFTTNNVLYQIKQLLDRYRASGDDANRNFFIFFKSTNKIVDIIKGLKLDDYAIYCSETKRKELRLSGITNVYDQIGTTFAKYNFFTSRFFSAVDIDYKIYKCDPIIIMVSDVISIAHSVIDPYTEAVQICGRFRSPEEEDGDIAVVKTVYHISNYDSKLTNFDEQEVKAILKDKHKLHQLITKYRPHSEIEYINKFIDEILALNGFNCFIKENGKLNHFMVDNFTNEERVKGYYKWSQSLISQYKVSLHFQMTQESGYQNYVLSDEEINEIANRCRSLTVNEFVSAKVKEIMDSGYTSMAQAMNLSMLRFSYPSQMGVIDSYGLENAAKLDYDIAKIQQLSEDQQSFKRLLPLAKYLQKHLKKEGYTSDELMQILSAGILDTGLTDLKPNIQLLRNFATLSDRDRIRKDENGKWLKGYKIIDFLQKLNMDRK